MEIDTKNNKRWIDQYFDYLEHYSKKMVVLELDSWLQIFLNLDKISIKIYIKK